MRYVLDNFPQENEEKFLGEQGSNSENISDIQFEEPQDDELISDTPLESSAQEQTEEIVDAVDEDSMIDESENMEQVDSSFLYEPLEDEISDDELTKKLESEFVIMKSSETFVPEQQSYEESPYVGSTDENAKKYVIYINPENIEFIDSLSVNERRDVINKILRETNSSIKDKKNREKRARFIKHAIVTSLTLILSIPTLFFIVNKSLEVSIENYQNTRSNFLRLYKEKGKIKSTEMPLSN